MTTDWDDFGFDFDVEEYYPKETAPDVPSYCFHEWKPILLIRSTVYNCVKCDKKKEEQ